MYIICTVYALHVKHVKYYTCKIQQLTRGSECQSVGLVASVLHCPVHCTNDTMLFYSTITFKQFGDLLKEASKAYAKDKKIDPADAEVEMTQKIISADPKHQGTTVGIKVSNKQGL